ncbi:MAG TPA: hypothetical protein VET25_12820, partial [Aestuariivirgaceae bacterium]|nr:hypothetical protein [Aestuariivirgaceae bacterium]
WNEGLTVALEWFEKSVQSDPDYALAHAGIALAYSYGLFLLGLPPDTALARAREHAQRAITLDDRNPTVCAYAALAYFFSGEHVLERIYAERAVSLNPNDPFTVNVLANVLTYTGEPELALEWFAKSERLEPYAPDDQRVDCLCDCYYLLGQYEKVIEIHQVYQNLPALMYLILAAACAQAGQLEKARFTLKEYERLRHPQQDMKTIIEYQCRLCSRQKDREHWLEGYRKAGIDV